MDKDEYLKLFQKVLEKRTDRAGFLNHIAPQNERTLEEINATELIGYLVVHEQILEENIKLLLSVVYSYKTASSNGKVTLIRQNDFNGLTLGSLCVELKKIILHETTGPQKQVDLLDDLKKKVSEFARTRNDYIHHLLQKDLKPGVFKVKIIEAILELDKLVDLSNDARVKVERHYNYDGNSLLSIAGHLIANDATKKG